MPRTFVQPVTIRGVTYPSQRAAAAALGVTEGRVSQAAINGRLHMLGTGPGNHGRVAMPCRGLDGKMYPTLTEAAAASGMSRRTFQRRMAKQMELEMKPSERREHDAKLRTAAILQMDTRIRDLEAKLEAALERVAALEAMAGLGEKQQARRLTASPQRAGVAVSNLRRVG
jgi:AraC-like DNA-binding protein